MNVVGVLVIKNKNIVVASGGRNWKLASPIRITFEERFIMKKNNTDLMSARSQSGS
jgi:hypothetical protein